MMNTKTIMALIGVIVIAAPALGVQPGDANHDNVVDLRDFSILRGGLGLISAQATSPFLLLIDPDTGQAWLKNTGAAAISITGYEILSAGGHLDTNGWESLMDASVTRPDDMETQLGVGSLTFQEGGMINENYLGEGNIHGEAVFQPGSPWPIGQLMSEVSLEDISFHYARPDDYIVYDGAVALTPEPATLSLLAIGGLAMLRRKPRMYK